MKEPITINIKKMGSKIKNHIKIINQLKKYNGPIIIIDDNTGSIGKLKNN